jgi:hypothetical protein
LQLSKLDRRAAAGGLPCLWHARRAGVRSTRGSAQYAHSTCQPTEPNYNPAEDRGPGGNPRRMGLAWGWHGVGMGLASLAWGWHGVGMGPHGVGMGLAWGRMGLAYFRMGPAPPPKPPPKNRPAAGALTLRTGDWSGSVYVMRYAGRSFWSLKAGTGACGR